MNTQETEQHPIDMQIGEKIRKRRLLCGFSQKKLGDKLGVSFQQVQRYEGGMSRITTDSLFKLAKALFVDISYFFTNTSENLHEKYPFHYGNDDIGSEEISRLVREYRKIKDEKLRNVVHSVMDALADK